MDIEAKKSICKVNRHKVTLETGLFTGEYYFCYDCQGYRKLTKSDYLLIREQGKEKKTRIKIGIELLHRRVKPKLEPIKIRQTARPANRASKAKKKSKRKAIKKARKKNR